MRVVGVCGTSGSGKTRLAEQLVRFLAQAGLKVSVIKHAHHNVDVDIPGKDSWKLRKAGAYETLLVSSQRWMLIRELEQENHEPDLHEVIAEMRKCDWVVFEGFKHADLNKIEVWRDANAKAPIYPDDPYVKAIITADSLPVVSSLPVFLPDEVAQIAKWIMSNADLFNYPVSCNDNSCEKDN